MPIVLEVPRKYQLALYYEQQRAVKYTCWAGTTGSGKTQSRLTQKIAQAMMYPGIRTVFIRSSMPRMLNTLIPSFNQALNRLKLQVKWNKNPAFHKATFRNGSEFLFYPFNEVQDKDFDKLKGLEATDAVIDEANEQSRRMFDTLKTRLGRWKNEEYGLLPKIDLLLNPTNCWIKNDFYERWKNKTLDENHSFFEFSPEDNPYLPETYWEGLATMNEEEKQRYLHNNWEYSFDPQNLLSYEWLKNVMVETYVPAHYSGFKGAGLDPASVGDEITLALCDGQCVYSLNLYPRTDKLVQTDTIGIWASSIFDQHRIGSQNVFVDSTGLGAGVTDTLHTMGWKVQRFYPGGRTDPMELKKVFPHYTFGNKRAETYWYLRELIRTDQIKIIYDEVLMKELLNIRWHIKGDALYIESKEEIRKRLGKSPDRADAVAMSTAFLLYQQVQGLQILI